MHGEAAPATKVESFNRFSQWVGFGNGGVIAGNNPVEQEKTAKSVRRRSRSGDHPRRLGRCRLDRRADGHAEREGAVPAGNALEARMRQYAESWGSFAYTLTTFSPVVDGEVLPEAPWQALAGGAGRDVDLIIGHNRHEYRLRHLR
ncbi:hypothetical protein [Nonomuraea phyllanthi]